MVVIPWLPPLPMAMETISLTMLLLGTTPSFRSMTRVMSMSLMLRELMIVRLPSLSLPVKLSLVKTSSMKFLPASRAMSRVMITMTMWEIATSMV